MVDLRSRAATWSSVAPPESERAAFLRETTAALRKMSKKELAGEWNLWSSCLATLAHDPRMLLGGAMPDLLGCTLTLLHKANPADVRDAALRDELLRVEAWCSQFVRNLLGGGVSKVDVLLTELRADDRLGEIQTQQQAHEIVKMSSQKAREEAQALMRKQAEAAAAEAQKAAHELASVQATRTCK